MTQKDKNAVIAALEEYKGDSIGLIAATIEDCQRVVREMAVDAVEVVKFNALKSLINGEWVDCKLVEEALGIDFATGLKMFDFSRTAEWNPAPLNGQKITTRFRLKNAVVHGRWMEKGKTMREKLIELLRQGLRCPPSANMECSDCRFYGIVGCWLQKAANHLIAHGVTIATDNNVGRWIPVTERLPEIYGTFLVAIDEVHGENRVSVDAADFDLFEKRWSTFGYFCAGYKITHWMPLPEPPKED